MAASLFASAMADHGASYSPLNVGNPFKRDVQTCEQSYGAGSVACGATDHGMCFNPSQGQVCMTPFPCTTNEQTDTRL